MNNAIQHLPDEELEKRICELETMYAELICDDKNDGILRNIWMEIRQLKRELERRKKEG